MTENNSPPRELNSVKEHKLTRRRVVKMASAVGLSSAVAAQMTVDDVKASDSDQVTISLDTHGQRKWTMEADYLDWIQRARNATERIKKNHFGKSGIHSVGMVGGQGEDNPHVSVWLEKNNSEKDERRGELPEESEGVRIETEEKEDEFELHCEPDCVPQGADFPGGQEIDIDNTGHSCTNGPRMIKDNYDWIGWSTAGHCFPNCSSDGTPYMYHTAEYCTYAVGNGSQSEGSFIEPQLDIGFVGYNDNLDISPSAWNYKPNDDRNEGAEINGTLSREGMAAIRDEYSGENKIYLYGVGSCFASGELVGWDRTKDVSDSPYSCRSQLEYQMEVDHGCLGDETANGDSGGIYFTPDPETDSWWALGSHTGGDGFCHSSLGAQGFTVYDKTQIAWR